MFIFIQSNIIRNELIQDMTHSIPSTKRTPG
jgi:hypothetical protein